MEANVPKTLKGLPYVPTEDEIKRYYEAVWKAKNFQDMMIIKTLLYTGVRVSELINIKLTDIDFHRCQIRSEPRKKDRIVPFPNTFKELLAMHADSVEKKGAIYLFESSWKKKYTNRSIRNILKSHSLWSGFLHLLL